MNIHWLHSAVCGGNVLKLWGVDHDEPSDRRYVLLTFRTDDVFETASELYERVIRLTDAETVDAMQTAINITSCEDTIEFCESVLKTVTTGRHIH